MKMVFAHRVLAPATREAFHVMSDYLVALPRVDSGLLGAAPQSPTVKDWAFKNYGNGSAEAWTRNVIPGSDREPFALSKLLDFNSLRRQS
jgi:hypothetical protein